jgi:hypothetical protein
VTTGVETGTSTQVSHIGDAVTVSSGSLICSPSLQEFYMSMMSKRQSGATGNGTSEIALKRRKINQNAAVITHENFTDAVAEIENMRVTGKSHCHSQQSKSILLSDMRK